MHAGGRQADQRVAGADLRIVHDSVAIHHAHGEAGQIVLVLGIEAGHFRRLAAVEGAARLHAALGYAGDDGRDLLGHVFAAGDVVQEGQGLRAAADDVVDAHGHAVDAHGVVLVHQEGDFELRAHAVGAADQHRALHVGHVQLEQAAKAAEAGQHARDGRARHVLLHQFYGLIAGSDVHAGLTIAFAETLHSSLASVILHSNWHFPGFFGGSQG